MEVATFTHSRTQQLGALVAGIVVFALFAPITILGCWLVFSSMLSGEKESLQESVIHIFGFGVMAWVLFWLSQQLRYRHAFRTTYVVDAQGILVNSQELRTHVRWDEFEIAEHFPMFFLARLKSSKVARPVILLLSTESAAATARSEFTRHLIEEKMGSRCKRRWL